MKVNIGMLREPIETVKKTYIDDGMGGKIEDTTTSLNVFVYWAQTKESRKVYLGLDSKVRYFDVVGRSEDLEGITEIKRNGESYAIQSDVIAMNNGTPSLSSLIVSL